MLCGRGSSGFLISYNRLETNSGRSIVNWAVFDITAKELPA